MVYRTGKSGKNLNEKPKFFQSNFLIAFVELSQSSDTDDGTVVLVYEY